MTTSLYFLKPKSYYQTIGTIAKKRTAKGNMVYACANKPHKQISSILEQQKVKVDRIFFIDSVGGVMGSKKDAQNVVMLQGPQDVTGLSIAIDEAVGAMPANTSVLVDSLSAMMLHNDEDVVGRFANFIVNRMKMKKVDLVLICQLAHKDNKTIESVEAFVDEVK